MIDALFNQPGYLGAKRLLDATVVRHDAIASNIANAETPGYKRIDLSPSFRQELKNALATHDAARLRSVCPRLEIDPQAQAEKRDGNTVNLERELIELSQNSLENAVESQMISASLARLRLAITGKT